MLNLAQARLDMLLLGLSDALLHFIAILLLFVVALMEILRYSTCLTIVILTNLYQCGTPPSVLHHGASLIKVLVIGAKS